VAPEPGPALRLLGPELHPELVPSRLKLVFPAFEPVRFRTAREPDERVQRNRWWRFQSIVQCIYVCSVELDALDNYHAIPSTLVPRPLEKS